MMAAGMKNGEIRPGPPCNSLVCSRSMTSNPPIPLCRRRLRSYSAISGVTFKARHPHGEIRCRHRELDEAADLLDFFFFEPVQRIEIPHFACNAAVVCRGVELRDRTESRFARDKVPPDFLCADPQVHRPTRHPLRRPGGSH